MKKLTFLFAILLLPLAASAVVIDDIDYNLDNDAMTAEVTGYGVYTGDVVIPESVKYDNVTYEVTSIREYAFCYLTRLTGITIPTSVTSIGNNAFEGCSGLTSIIIPNSVTSIGEWAFNGCSGLTSIMVESGNKNYDSRDNCNAIIETASNTLILGSQNTTIPNSVTSISGSAFGSCSNLTSIDIPNSVTSIGEGVFSDSGLTSVTIGNSVTSIGNYAFWGCRGLTSVIIPNSVTSIGDNAFSECRGLTNVTIGNSVTTIGNYAFNSCTCLTNVTIPNSVTTIGDNAFSECRGLTSVTIPNSVTTIGRYAFSKCESLTSVTIPNSVTTIGNYAFDFCERLTSVTIPNSVTTIGNCAFEGTWLTSVTIPNSVTTIGDNAFSFCDLLTSVTIGNSVTTIGRGAFNGCGRLTDVMVKMETPINSFPFNIFTIPNATLYVPNGSRDAYMEADHWNEFKEIREYKQCATPTITMKDGELGFSCKTEGVSFVYSLSTPAFPNGEGLSLTIPTTYTINVYAKKDFYIDSEPATMEIELGQAGLEGDVNSDGFVDATDLTKLIDILLK